MSNVITFDESKRDGIKQAKEDLLEIKEGIIDVARDYALELLRALDEKQPHYEPKSKEWLSDTANKLVDVLYGIDGGTQ